MSEENSLYNFRKTRWGMSIAQVKSSEDVEVLEEGKIAQVYALQYKTIVIAKSVIIFYVFIDDQLVRAKYILDGTHENDNLFINDYSDFTEILTKKYGKPKEENVFWNDDLYKDNPSNWGYALSKGHLSYFSTWESKDTAIVASLTGDNFEIRCHLEYRSKELEDLEEKASEKEVLDLF